MSKASLKKQLSDNIGRLFNLTFNHIVMYNAYHKSAVSSLERFYHFLQDGFNLLDIIAISLNQDVVFVEEEPLDSRINTTKLVAHFKKTDIQSISFEAGLALGDVTLFFEILTDLRRYRNAIAMKKALRKKGLEKIAINYFVYAKVKSDETVVHTSRAGKGTTGEGDVPTAEDVLAIMATDILSEELRKNLSIHNMMGDPGEFSRMLVREDADAARKTEAKNVPPGAVLVQSLARFQGEVNRVLEGRPAGDVNISRLAEDVFELKRQLMQGIEDQKSRGVIYLDEQKIRQEADEITDGVLVKLIAEEYNKGAVSINRLAQITLRLVSQAQDLKRILPKMKRALLASGMSLADFLQFVQEVKNELQSDELTSVLERSADAIGLEGEDLVREIMQNPQDAAELIYLAAEIRKGGDDSGVLSRLMADYVEEVGTGLAVDELGRTADVDGDKISSIFSRIRRELLGKLKQRELDSSVLADLEKRLTRRMDESLRQLKSTMVFNRMRAGGSGAQTKEAVLKLLKSHAADADEFRAILTEVEAALSKKGVATDVVRQLYREIDQEDAEKETPNQVPVNPPGSLNRGSTLFVLEKEILRANRYDTTFSMLSFSVVKATPRRSVKRAGAGIKTENVIAAFVAGLTEIIRETDLAGMLGAKMVVVVQPMTNAAGARIALDRITKKLKQRQFVVGEVPFDLIFAGAVTPFDPERTPDLRAFVRLAQTELKNIADRTANIQRMI